MTTEPAAPARAALHPGALRVQGITRRGKPCELIDNTGEQLPETELQDILQRLIEQDAFGFKSRSASGANTLNLDAAETAHIQIGERLYRLTVARYQARIDPF